MSAISTDSEIKLVARHDLPGRLHDWEAYVTRNGSVPLSRHPGWLIALERGLRHVPYALEAVRNNIVCGLLPLSYVNSFLFGRFLVGLPYLNYGGVLADDNMIARALLDKAIGLADQLKVRHLELRSEQPIDHPALARPEQDKVHMQLKLPMSADELWKNLNAKVRNQIRKAQKSNLTMSWGREELLSEFYDVFSLNMRDLGTPVFGRRLFTSILQQFPDRAELCVVRLENKPIACGLLLHGWGITEVPSASSLREYNSTSANMLLYWHLLERAIERKQSIFDFGRSSPDSNTFRFKKQWGAEPKPAAWQFYLRQGKTGDMRPDNPKYQRMIRIWQKLPVGLTRLIGPPIVRGIP